jgi:hypothetical protein
MAWKYSGRRKLLANSTAPVKAREMVDARNGRFHDWPTSMSELLPLRRAHHTKTTANVIPANNGATYLRAANPRITADIGET